MLLYDGPIEASIGFVFFAGSKPRLRYKLALRVFRLAARDFIDPRVPRARSSATIFFLLPFLSQWRDLFSVLRRRPYSAGNAAPCNGQHEIGRRNKLVFKLSPGAPIIARVVKSIAADALYCCSR